MIKAVIIEDEPFCAALLRDMLQELAADIEVLAFADNVSKAIDLIRNIQPQLVFLDIQLNGGSGFEVLQGLPDLKFEVIFTTAFNQYAIQAFEVAALHYLLKPITEGDLIKAIDRYRRQHPEESVVKQAQQAQLLSNSTSQKLERIGLPTQNTVIFIEIAHLYYIEADASYCFFYLDTGQRIMVSKPLRLYEQMLESSGFYRIHDKYLVNLNQVSGYVKGRGGQAKLKNGALLDVSVRRKEGFLQALKS